MTPKEKAKEIERQIEALNVGEVGEIDILQRTECAKLVVDEVISVLHKNNGYTQCAIDLDYWELVKYELDKL
jgi:hypothetical protein